MASEKQDKPKARQPGDAEGLDQAAIDALLAGGTPNEANASEERAPESPQPVPDAEPEDATLSQEDLDALLAQLGAQDAPSAAELTDDTSLAPDSLDAPLVDPDAGDQSVLPGDDTEVGGTFASGEDDSVMSESEPRHPALSDEPIVPNAPKTPTEPADAVAEDLDEERLNQILADVDASEAAPDPTAAEVGGENLAAAAESGEAGPAEAEDPLLTQDMLDQLIEQARKEREENAHKQSDPWLEDPVDDEEENLLSELKPAPKEDAQAPPPADEAALPTMEAEAASEPSIVEAPSEAAPSAKPKKVRKPFRVSPGAKRQMFKLAVSVAGGVMAAAAVYVYGNMFPTRGANMQALNRISAPPIEEVLPQARELITLEKYGEAIEILEPSMRGAEPSDALTAARFLKIQATYRGIAPYATESELQALMRDIDSFTVDNPADPRSAQVLLWKGRLYEQQGIPYAARQAYERILMDFPEIPDRDRLHFDVARLSLDLGRSYDAIDALRSLLLQHPSSPYAGEAKVLLGDAHLAAGELAVARQLYEQLAETAPNSAVGGQAYSRLGRMAFNEGRYDDAIALLEERRRRATTIDGNDEVFLLLGRSYRAVDRLDDAERVLRELIDFFPESAVMPAAYDELASVLEARGRRDEALQVARQAAERYPNDPEVLRQTADLLAATGQHRAAAEKYLQAEAAGIRDPAMLLAAAQAFEQAGFTNSAMDVYRRTADLYPSASEAVDATISHARMLHEQGSTGQAIDRLEALALTLGPGPERLPVLVSLGRIYRGLGADQRAGELFAEAAANTNEPELLAESAAAMLEAGRWAEGFALANRVPLDRLAPDAGYEFLMAQADAYLRTDSNRAILLMEQAHEKYPEQRTEAGEEKLFKAYLATNQPARARAMLTDIRNRAEAEPIYARQLRERALAWADYSFDRRDFREAADAYALAVNPQGTSTDDHHWARFQQANALRQLGEESEALALYDAIAASPSPWARDAAIKAQQIRLDQRFRHEEVTPMQTAES